MIFNKTKIADMYLIGPEIFKDKRGYFRRNFCEKKIKEKNISFRIKQCNVSENFKKGTLRGFHFQKKSKNDSKIITCISGKIHNVTIDLRKNSKTYLSVKKFLFNKDIYIAEINGKIGHGMLSLKDNTLLMCSTNIKYNPKNEKVFNWKKIKFNWPFKNLILSKKDT